VPRLFYASGEALVLVLLALLLLPPAQAQSVPARELFGEPPVVDGGWQGLARALEALSPGVDTDAPLTPADISNRLTAMLDAGQYAEALDIIEKYERLRSGQNTPGTDVQLLFQKGRALSGLGRAQEALALYQDMTVRFPELPEPWNNLAVAYLGQDQLERARDALQMALSADPHYRTAQINLGRVYLMLSRQVLAQAAKPSPQQPGQPQEQRRAAGVVSKIDDILRVY